MTTPMCPKCGSVKVSEARGILDLTPKPRFRPLIAWRCREKDCGHMAGRSAFLTGGPQTGQSQHSNDHWRDGAALSMDGIKS